MNTLADEFLADLGEESVSITKEADNTAPNEAEDEENEMENEGEDETKMELDQVKEKYQYARQISKLWGSDRLNSLLEVCMILTQEYSIIITRSCRGCERR